MIKLVVKDSDMAKATKIVLDLIDKAEDKNATVEEYFDSKNYDNNLMIRIVNYPHSIFVGEWNDDRTVANQIGRIEVEKAETLEHLANRLKGVKDAHYEENLFGEAVDPKKFIEDLGFECHEDNHIYDIKGNKYKLLKVFSKDFVSPYDYEKNEFVQGGWESSVKYEDEQKLKEALKEKFGDCRPETEWTGTIDLFIVWVPVENTEINDELIKNGSEEAFKENVKTEIEAGKDPKQAVAIAHSIKRKYKDSKADKKFKIEWYIDGELISEEDVFYSEEEAKQYAENHYREIETYAASNGYGTDELKTLAYEIREML